MLSSELSDEGTYIAINDADVSLRITSKIANNFVYVRTLPESLPDIGAGEIER
jgi:hypothetical protein